MGVCPGVCASSGWIDRQGKFYPCAPLAHMYAAKEICEALGIVAPLPESALEDLGYVKISAGQAFAGNKCMNKAQEACVVDVAAAYYKDDQPHMAGALMRCLACMKK